MKHLVQEGLHGVEDLGGYYQLGNDHAFPLLQRVEIDAQQSTADVFDFADTGNEGVGNRNYLEKIHIKPTIPVRRPYGD
jgi:hypothetical protein